MERLINSLKALIEMWEGNIEIMKNQPQTPQYKNGYTHATKFSVDELKQLIESYDKSEILNKKLEL